MFKTEKIAGWANFPTVEAAAVAEPKTVEAMRQVLLEKTTLLARGNGRSYGDASLFETIVSTRKFNKFLDFDSKTGLFTCQSGVLFSEIMDWAVLRGWFFEVVPGHKFVSIGGAIAADVHGKNHPTAGSFSKTLAWFEILTADGSLKKCSRSENTDLFWQTIGGFGWTGIVTTAAFYLRKISTDWMKQETLRAADLDALFELFDQSDEWNFRAAWIDFSSKNGRGLLFRAEHLEAENSVLENWKPQKSRLSVPFFAPPFLLNSLTINAFNQFIWLSNRVGEQRVSLEKFFFPLDAVQNWNRLYGRRGFQQYQFCLPENMARTGIRRAFELIKSSGELPFLVVLKRFGEQPTEARNSFPMCGFTLALDFPRRSALPILLKKLDDLLLELGGKIYLAKDASSDPRLARLDEKSFPETRFTSLLRKRIFPKND